LIHGRFPPLHSNMLPGRDEPLALLQKSRSF
jgi:hypothetical protein